MVRECRYLGDNAEQFSPSQQRVRPDDFDAHWPSSHRPDGPKKAARRRRRERKRKNSNDAQRGTQD